MDIIAANVQSAMDPLAEVNRPAHICTGTALAPAHICAGTALAPARIRTGTGVACVQASRLLAVSAAHAAALDRLKATRHRQQQAEAERLAAKMEAKQAKIDEAAERRSSRHMSQAQRLRLRRWLRFCAFVSRSYAMQQTFEKALIVERVCRPQYHTQATSGSTGSCGGNACRARARAAVHSIPHAAREGC